MPIENQRRLREYLRRATAGHEHERRRGAELEARVPAVDTAEPDSIAIVGMACRWPGGIDTPEALWRLLIEEREVLVDFPDNRGWHLERFFAPYPGAPGHCYVRAGGFMPGAGHFDAGFFGLAADEAATVDPQQRLLLKTAWEAVERAKIDPASLNGSDTGVFVGMTAQGYCADDRARPLALESGDHFVLGTVGAFASGRIAYTLGLQGPALTLDTACSSALSALHQACRSLRSRECSLALAGAASVIALPDVFIEYCRRHALSRDGRSKPYSAKADGGNWAEGGGMLLLERLGDAQRHGRQVLAVIRGSAVNQNGQSNGLSVPNGPAQCRLVARALADAGLRPADIDLVEGHGVGEPMSDLVETEALCAAYGARPPERPLLIGSVKSNFGHTQAASGLAAVMKLVLALQHGFVPTTLNADPPLEAADPVSGMALAVARAQHWPDTGQPRRAAASAFGAAGTNGHVIVEQAPDNEAPPTQPQDTYSPGGSPVPWTLSAASEPALRAQAGRLLDHLAGHSQIRDLDIAWSLAATRADLSVRAAIGVRDRPAALAAIRALAEGRHDPGLLPDQGPRRADWARAFEGHSAHAVSLPTYAFQEEHLWGR